MLSFIVFMVILSVFFGFVDFYCCVLCFVFCVVEYFYCRLCGIIYGYFSEIFYLLE